MVVSDPSRVPSGPEGPTNLELGDTGSTLAGINCPLRPARAAIVRQLAEVGRSGLADETYVVTCPT